LDNIALLERVATAPHQASCSDDVLPADPYLGHDGVEAVLGVRPLLGVQVGGGVERGQRDLDSNDLVVRPLDAVRPNA